MRLIEVSLGDKKWIGFVFLEFLGRIMKFVLSVEQGFDVSHDILHKSKFCKFALEWGILAQIYTQGN